VISQDLLAATAIFSVAAKAEGEISLLTTLVTVTLTERGGKTEMSFRQTGFDSVESRDGHAGGWNECFAKLENLLSESRRNR